MYALNLQARAVKPYTHKVLAILLAEVQLFIMIFPFADLFAALPQFNMNPVVNLLNALLTGLSLLYIVHVKTLKLRLADHWLLLTYLLLLIISTYWVDPSMLSDSENYTSRTLLTVVRALVIVLVFLERPGQFLIVLRKFAIVMTILSALFILIYPEESNWALKEPERHQSFFSSPNNLGQFIAFAFIIINFFNRKSNSLKTILILNALLFFEAHKCDSVTSQTGVMICAAAYFFRFILRPMFYVAMALAIGVPIYTHMRQASNAEQIEFANRDMTFTGRSDVWDIEFNDLSANHREALGFGSGGYWGEKIYHPKSTINELDWEPHQGHNGYLDIRIMTGYVGLIIVVLFLINFIAKLFRRKDLEDVVYFIPMIILINNLTEASLFRTKHFYFVLLMLMYWYTTLKPKQEDAPGAQLAE
jgi:O-antigen ligase